MNISISNELKRKNNFVYCINGNYFIIGLGTFLECPDDIKNIYEDFIEGVRKLKSELKKENPQKLIFSECLKLFNKLTHDIKSINFNNYDENYIKELKLLDMNLTIEEKIELKRQKDLYISFYKLADRVSIKDDIQPEDLDFLNN